MKTILSATWSTWEWEPFSANDQVIDSVYLLIEYNGINLDKDILLFPLRSKRNKKLAQEKLQVTGGSACGLCQLRDRLCLLTANTLRELLEEDYISRTNRRVTFEYIMLDDVNLSRDDADKNHITKPLLANINLIPYNEVETLPLSPSNKVWVLSLVGGRRLNHHP